jgi:hypothetical protein
VTTPAGAPAALAQLAAALGPQFSTTLVRQPGRQPRLAVVDKHSQATTEVYADDSGRMWWQWAEQAAITNDPLTAAHQVTATLRPGGPGQGQQ